LLKFESDLVCAPCCHGKMIAASHSPVNTMMTEHPGQLLHMNTVDPSRVRSMGGKWYVLVIIDDYSRYSWVFFLESKDQVFEHFQLLALWLNNEHPNCLNVIRSDNGTEFRNASFDEFCLEHGIDQQFSTLRVPQQNGVVERKNCTLVEMARMMLDEYMTPRRFWANAISTACYISNQIFLRSILHLTPFELRFGHKPSVSHFRPFGCKCFVLKCGNLDKFESRSFDGILLG
jgi:transposase InsO family protein